MSSLRNRFREFLFSLRTERDVLGTLLVAGIAFYVATSLCLALGLNGVSRFMLERFQLRSSSFAAWAVFAPSAWMYNFENRVLASELPLSSTELERATLDGRVRYINHFPTRVATYADTRERLMQSAKTQHMYFESRYRDQTVRSVYRLHADESGRTELTRIESP